jgi:hypothetical protein
VVGLQREERSRVGLREDRSVVGLVRLLQGQQHASVQQLPQLLLVVVQEPRSELLLPLPSALQLSRQRRVCSVVGLVRPLQARPQAQALVHLVLERHQQEPLLPHLPHRHWGLSGRLLVGGLGLLQGQLQASAQRPPMPHRHRRGSGHLVPPQVRDSVLSVRPQVLQQASVQ